MSQIRISRRAQTDLLQIWNRIADDNVEAADRLRQSIDRTVQGLAEMPGMGRKRDELETGLRSFPIGVYVIFYRPTEEGIRVVRVLHGMRDLPRLF